VYDTGKYRSKYLEVREHILHTGKHSTTIYTLYTTQQGRARYLMSRDRDETRDACLRDRDETETLGILSEMRPRREVSTSRDRLKTETSRPRPHPCDTVTYTQHTIQSCFVHWNSYTDCRLSGASSLRSPASLTKLYPPMNLLTYIHSLLKHYVPSHSLHSFDSNLLSVHLVSVHVSVLVAAKHPKFRCHTKNTEENLIPNPACNKQIN